MLLVALLIAPLVAPGGYAVQKPARARVYVFTAETAGGSPSDDLKDRENAVKELRDALAKKKGIEVVDDRAGADIQLEIVKCEAVTLGGGGFGGKMITPLDEKIIHIHAVSPADNADFKGTAPGYWGRAAKDAADRLAKWIARQPKGSTNGR